MIEDKIAIGAPNSVARFISNGSWGENKFAVVERVKGELVLRAAQTTMEGAARYCTEGRELIDIADCHILPLPKGCGEFTRVSGTNVGGMACGGNLRHLTGEFTKEFCADCTAKMNGRKRWLPCGLCHGSGKQTEYEDTWDCPPCDGKGGSWIEK